MNKLQYLSTKEKNKVDGKWFELLLTAENAKVRSQILLTVEVASKCGQAISMSEIVQMLPLQQKLADVQEIIRSDPAVSKSVTADGEFVVLRGFENLFSERVLREKTSERCLETARTFAHELLSRSRYADLIAVCGSVAYRSAKHSDDIDIFLITKNNRMWLSFIKALLLARAYHIKALVNGEELDFCLSYVQEKKQFEEEISRHRLPLFAREFLSLQIITGASYYNKLLEKTSWMLEVFPRLYFSRLKQSETEEHSVESENQFGSDASNLFVYAALKSYLLFKAFLRNLTYRKQLRIKDVFEAKITRNTCVYNSERYRELENTYDSKWSSG